MGVLWRGCGFIRESKLIICGLGCKVRWYVTKGWGFEGFLKKWVKRLNLNNEYKLRWYLIESECFVLFCLVGFFEDKIKRFFITTTTLF